MSAIQKYSKIVKDFQFCDDFGKEPVLLAHVTQDASTIAVISLLGGFVAMAALGLPGLALVAFAAFNDIGYARSHDGDDDELPTVREGSIDVQSVPVGETKAIAPSMSHITSPVWNPAEDLGNNPQSALIVGVPGSGKGMLVSNAIRTLKAKYPDLKIFVIDPKADPKERGYWEGLADHYKAFSLMKCSDPDEGAEWLLDCMTQFTAMSGPKLCIFDELMSASTELSLAHKDFKALPRLKKFVVGLIGQGDSQGTWLWAMTQSPQVADMGMSGGVRANLRAIGLVSPKNMAAVEALVSTNLIPKPPGGMDELRQIMEASPVNRAVFDGKLARWLPMPKLENHSGFDRDNRTIQKEEPIEVSPIEKLEALYQASSAPDIETSVMGPSSKSWEFIRPDQAIDIKSEESHPLQDKFDRIEALLNGQESIGIRDISRAFNCKSDESTQLAQMFCLSQKSRYKFTQAINPNGMVSKSIYRL